MKRCEVVLLLNWHAGALHHRKAYKHSAHWQLHLYHNTKLEKPVNSRERYRCDSFSVCNVPLLAVAAVA
jgi:hypothetical protein